MTNFLLGVLSSLVASFIFVFLVYGKTIFKLRSKDLQLFWSMTKRLRANGIVNFFASRADYVKYREHGTVTEYMATTKRELVYIGFWLSHGTEMTNIRETLDKILSRGCYVEFIFVNPQISYLSNLADFLAIPEESILSRINQSINQMKEMRNSLPDNLKQRFILKTHDKLVTSSAFLIDQDTESEKILVDFKLYSLGREQTFGIEFNGKRSGSSLHSRMFTSLLNIRESAVILSDE